MTRQRRSLSQPATPGAKAGHWIYPSSSLPNTVHPLSWGHPQGECFLCYIPRGPAHPWGLRLGLGGSRRWRKQGKWIFQI